VAANAQHVGHQSEHVLSDKSIANLGSKTSEEILGIM
jgi:hypothetical protein